MSKVLPYSMQDVDYDNAKFRPRSSFQVLPLHPFPSPFLLLLLPRVMSQRLVTKGIKRSCMRCSTGKLLLLLMVCGVTYLVMTHKNPVHSPSSEHLDGLATGSHGVQAKSGGSKLGRIWRKPPRLPPQLPPDEVLNKNSVPGASMSNSSAVWTFRQEMVRKAFVHAWSGYRNYAMGYDELMPLSKRGTDGLGGLGATIVDSLDTAMIMGLDEIVSDAGAWIENHLSERINQKGQVNLFETTIRVLGGLLSAYHLRGGDHVTTTDLGFPLPVEGPKPEVYLEVARNLADRLLSAFTSSPTSIPFSDVILHDRTAHPAPDGLSSTSEVSSVQLEFNYLSAISGDPKYGSEAMKVLEHFKTLPKVEGLVPIYISPHSGQFSGENIRLGSRGDSYYEYLIKVWLQQRGGHSNHLKYLHDMYEESMKGVRNLLVRKTIPKGLVFVGELPFGSNGAFSPKMDHLVWMLLHLDVH
ncbi:hypothetical protein Taro_004031 [Colocasia esculenta]|uniref:alpha-1,2-Mannosidase n=1 Tax=Colocasia esculenta TaxID=4460 RepID=A0A843TLC9_COLES|nr:hypothetical protein [Colocasia esculenta]